MNIILASASPRRAELLNLAHVQFDTLSVDIDESYLDNESPTHYIYRMVEQKMHSAVNLINTLASTPILILTADTIGVLGEQILTKPADKADAFAMWRAMSGNHHEVWTAVQAALVKNGRIIWQKSILDKTSIKFVSVTDEMMAYYWQTGEPCDKAGAYAIQGFGATWVESIYGNYTNVVGLPLPSVLKLIELARRICHD